MSSDEAKARPGRGILAAVLCLAAWPAAWSQNGPERLVVAGPEGVRELRTDADPCEDAPAIRRQVDDFQAEFAPGAADLDADGLPEDASVRLMIEAACRDANPSLQTAAIEAYNANLAILDSESDVALVADLRQGLAALLSISAATQAAVFDTLTDGGVLLEGDYFVVTCSGTTDCIAESPIARAADEPFSGPGDIDGDGVTNAEEFHNVVIVGGTLGVFIVVAFDSTEDGTNLILLEDDGATCAFVAVLRGTPFVDRLTGIRAWRDGHLLTSSAGSLVADVYYRVSPALAGALQARPDLLRAIREMISFWDFDRERTSP